MKASDVIDRCADQLKDVAHDRWTVASLLRWIGDAQRMVVTLRPAANASYEPATLIDGTRQPKPADVFRILDVKRNLTQPGDRPGRAITFVDFAAMDSADPNWHARKKERVVRNWLYDDRDPGSFYVYPPASATTPAPKVELLVSKMPAAPLAQTDDLALDDEYLDAVMAYVMFLAYTVEADYANHGQGQAWLQAFGSVMKGKPLSELRAGPKGTEPGAPLNRADSMGSN